MNNKNKLWVRIIAIVLSALTLLGLVASAIAIR